MANNVLEGVNKLFVGFHRKNITNKGFQAHKELGISSTIVNGGCIGIYGVGGNGFLATGDVMCREGGLEVPPQVRAHRDPSKLGGIKPRMLNRVNRLIGKERDEAGKVGIYFTNGTWPYRGGGSVSRWGDMLFMPEHEMRWENPIGKDIIADVSHGDNICIFILPILVEVVVDGGHGTVIKGERTSIVVNRRVMNGRVPGGVKGSGIPVLVTSHDDVGQCLKLTISVGPEG
jgi:hypothetical protein